MLTPDELKKLKEIGQLYNLHDYSANQPQFMQELLNKMRLGLMATGSPQQKANNACDRMTLLYRNSPDMKAIIEQAFKGNQVAIDQLKLTNGNLKNVLKMTLVHDTLKIVIKPEVDLEHKKEHQKKLEQSSYLPFSDFGHQQHNPKELAAKKPQPHPKPDLDEDEKERLKNI